MNKFLRVISWPFDWAGEKVAFAFVRFTFWHHGESWAMCERQDFVFHEDGGFPGPWAPDELHRRAFNVDGTPMLGPVMDFNGNFYGYPGSPD